MPDNLVATFAGFAGSFFAARQGLVTPESFTFIESAIILAIVVLGGMGSQIGVVIAALIVIGLPEGRFVRTVVAIGHPTEASRRPKTAPGEARLPRPATVFEERWPPEG